jgi:hypothetical protein
MASHAGPARSFTLLLYALGLSACFGDSSANQVSTNSASCPTQITDTLGDKFGFDCQSFKLIVLPSSPKPPACDPQEGQVFFSTLPSERLLRVCYAIGDPDGWGTLSAEQCRPVACKTSRDCPGATCHAGLCEFGNGSVSGEDATVLCLADVPWPRQCGFDGLQAAASKRLTALEPCLEDDSAPCKVPAACRQP